MLDPRRAKKSWERTGHCWGAGGLLRDLGPESRQKRWQGRRLGAELYVREDEKKKGVSGTRKRCSLFLRRTVNRFSLACARLRQAGSSSTTSSSSSQRFIHHGMPGATFKQWGHRRVSVSSRHKGASYHKVHVDMAASKDKGCLPHRPRLLVPFSISKT